MGFSDMFKGKQYKAELDTLQQQYDELKSMLTPEMQDILKQKEMIQILKNEKLAVENQIESLNQTISDKTSEICDLNNTIQKKKSEIIWMDDEILVQEFGL